MSQWRVIKNAQTNETVLARAKCCAGFLCHLKGLQFMRTLPEDEGLLFARHSESRLATAVHTFFMFYSIAVVWLDKDRVVIDQTAAKPWRPVCMPKSPAMYVLEAHPSLLNRVKTGDELKFDEVIC